jgi:hypothetical protein
VRIDELAWWNCRAGPDDFTHDSVPDEIPHDAHELLPPAMVEHWLTSGARVGDDWPELEPLRPLIEQLRDEGHSELSIACVIARMVRLRELPTTE